MGNPAPQVIVLGIPYDEHSSFLRGTAGGPTTIRRALHSGSANMTAESGVDLDATPGWEDHGDLAIADGPGAIDAITDGVGILSRLPPTLIGADIVEYNPTRDLHDMTAMVATKLYKEVVALLLAVRATR